MKAIDIIEPAKSYYLLSNDKTSKPFLVGNRIQLELALEKVNSKMIIATAGNNKRCVILIDYSSDKCWELAQLADKKIMRLKAKN
jgi:hypothetical protein